MSAAKWDQRRFDRTFKQYMRFTSRSGVVAINTKAYYIARKAVWFTHKADRGKIASVLGEVITVPKPTKTGRVITRKRVVLVKASKYSAPLAAVIINKRRGKKSAGGKGGLYGTDMARAIRDMLAARMRSIAYIKSGWLAAIRTLQKLADRRGEPTIDESAEKIGKPKGQAIPAVVQSSGMAVATIINETWTKHDPNGAAMFKYGASGLQKAFNDEAGSMSQYIKDKLKDAEKEFNAAQG
jgi:hypothetical protein